MAKIVLGEIMDFFFKKKEEFEKKESLPQK